MSIIGDIVGSIAKAVLPAVVEAMAPEGIASTHHDAGASQSAGHAAPVTDPLSKFVAMNGLHSIARQ
jgi:hypothetical protein